ncbi:MAG: caspase domain-containing protein [Candidatus Poribacteria bacterium]
MFRTKQTLSILAIMLVLSFLLSACGSKMPAQAPVQTPQRNQTPVPGEIELISAEPIPRPAWLQEPESESDQEYLAFKGTSLDAAHPKYAEELARRDANIAIGRYLFTHVDSRVKESLKHSGVSSGIYDARITEATVNNVASDVFVIGAYPSQYYTEYFRRYERGRWVYYYRVQALVKFPRDEVARAAEEARLRTLKRLKETTTEPVAQTKIQAEINQIVPGSQPEGRIWALLVGIDKYKSLGITPLRFAAQDAKVFAAALSEVTPESQVWLMTDDMEYENEPTNTNVLFQLKQMSELVGPKDTLIFSFSGHSISRNGKHFLLSVNADIRTIETLESSSISVDSLRQVLNRCKARQVIFFLDGCRNDPESGKGDSDNLLTKGFVQRLVEGPDEAENLRRGFAVLFACSVGDRAYEWPAKKQGVFSYFLVRGFKGEAADANGQVTVTGLATYLQQQVTAWSQKNRPSGQWQTPWLHLEGQPPMVLR